MENHHRSLRLIVLLVLSVFLLNGCGTRQPAPAPTPTSTSGTTDTHQVTTEEISLTTEDNVKLAGTLYLPAESDIAVVLAHQGTTGADQRTWQPFAQLIAEKGFTALTFDFRGCGQSEGPLGRDRMDRDIRAAIDLLNERGFKRIVCMGASMGGTTCLKGAVDRELAGVAVIASSISLGGSNKVSFQDLSELTTPKLFICAQDDTVNGRATGLASAITTMYKRSAEPKEIRIFPGTAHGTDLFDTESGDEFRDLLVNFLEGLR